MKYAIWMRRVKGCIKDHLDARNGVNVDGLCIYLSSLEKRSLTRLHMGTRGNLISANKSSKGCWNGTKYHQSVLEWL
jgi:hypothetical protein